MTNIDNNLVRQIISKRVVPFIGAGFSRDFGYPGWNELLKIVMDEINISDMNKEHIDGADPLQVAQALLDFYKETNYERFENILLEEIGIAEDQSVRDKINEYLSSNIKREIHQRLEREFSQIVLNQIKQKKEHLRENDNINKLKKLGNLDFKQILTTNYDNVLEEEIFKSNNFQVLSLGNGDELNWDDSYNTIYKIHGDVKNPKEIIFTHGQYYKFIHQFGYFRSKLYTLFSSNVILMMGYGFSDINIHQTYFQFIRDYDNDSSLEDKKFYMVLTQHDKDRWKSYFKYYKRYLSSYKINVIEVETLPDFIEELSDKVKYEKASSNLNSLFSFHDNDNDNEAHIFSEVLLKVIDNKNTPIIDNYRLNLDILTSFHKIYKAPYILKDEPFNKSVEDDILASEIASNIFKYTDELVKEFDNFKYSDEFTEIVNDSLDFVNNTGDFYEIENRVKDFIKLSNNLKQNAVLSSDVLIGEKMNNMFSKCHPTKYLRSNPGGRTLLKKLTEISTYHINSFFCYLESELEEDYLLSELQLYWLDELITVTHGEINERASKILKTHSQLKE